MEPTRGKLQALREEIRRQRLACEREALQHLIGLVHLTEADRGAITDAATTLVRTIRTSSRPRLMESFLEEYGLSTREGIALMCLAEALLRVPDSQTIDALIEDKIAPSDWGRHLGRSSSSLVNASTWALMLTGRVLEEDAEDDGLGAALHAAVKRLSEPVIRTAVTAAMRELGRQFVLGQDIGEALATAREKEAAGFTFSYDMLGEAALTAPDAARYHDAYAQAIAALAAVARSSDIRANPGISIKLSALHPRYHYAQRQRVMDELVPRVLSLAKAASAAHIGLNIDAEEADRLDLSLDVIETVLADPGLAGWEGFGIVVQAYGQRARPLLAWIDALAEALERRVMVRLVKGAYWDTEIKRAQILGIERFPVFTRKAATDVSYIANARLLLAMSGRVYPQFATHNAHTAAAVLHMAGAGRDFEFQRLHGMGEALHDHLHAACGVRSRIYAPVGAHEDLLAYLVRRLLENGANSSFVNQIIDEDVPPEEVAADPFEKIARAGAQIANPLIVRPPDLFGERRRNSKGFDLADPLTVADLKSARAAFASHLWRACPLIAAPANPLPERDIVSPADPACRVGRVAESSPADVEAALSCAAPWSAPVAERVAILQRASDLFEAHAAELHALAAREAGKTWPDCVSEVREAVDFLRYYAEAARRQSEGEPRGIFTCISPWNFPLAIFTGQIAAALATGNGVLAKPAEATPLIAMRAVELLHAAGVPRPVLQLLPGEGGTVGAALTSDPRVDGVCFTGSTATAQAINRAMAQTLDPLAPLIAETGGINAMIVDSTALPEQAVRDILASAFQSAGQRCSALRVLYIQNDIADRILEMLFGAMDELVLGDPQLLKTDIGPLIDAEAQRSISAYVEAARDAGRLLKQLAAPPQGFFVGPAVIAVSSIADLHAEIFGPVLHVARYEADEIDAVIAAINASGYGLTFGLHTRIDDRVQHIVERLRVGNIYVNRNQIGAVVGSQPFGGEGLSGTGPKAGGPHYLSAFLKAGSPPAPRRGQRRRKAHTLPLEALQQAVDGITLPDPQPPLATLDLPGPTGESNRLSLYPRGIILCLGTQAAAVAALAREVQEAGCWPLAVAPGISEGLDGVIEPESLARVEGIAGVACAGDADMLRACRRALAARPGPILPLMAPGAGPLRYRLERHLCIDTTASGGNAALLALSG